MGRWVLALVWLLGCQTGNRAEVAPPPEKTSPPSRVFSWELVPETVDIHDGIFLDEREGWLVGDHGTILHTGTGGKTWDSWRRIDLPFQQPLRWIAGVKTPEGNLVMAAGSDTILRFTSATSGWESLGAVEGISGAPQLHRHPDGRVEAWVNTVAGVLHSSDIRTGTLERDRSVDDVLQRIRSDDRQQPLDSSPLGLKVGFAANGDTWLLISDRERLFRRLVGSSEWSQIPFPREFSFNDYTIFTARLVVSGDRRKLWLSSIRALSEWTEDRWMVYTIERKIPPALASVKPVQDSLGTRKYLLFPAHGRL